MNLVPKNINEAIKHLSPKSEEEIRSSFKNLSPQEKLETGSEEGLLWLVKDALAAGADVHADNDYALRLASRNGHVEVVKVLLAAGTDVHARDDLALRWASENGHVEVVKVLLAVGADVHARDDYALQWASKNGHVEVVKVLLAAGADVHAGDDYALQWASEKRRVEVVKVLQDHIKKKKINEAIKHLSPKSEEELLQVVEKEPLLKQLQLMNTSQYNFLHKKFFPITSALKKQIREEVYNEINSEIPLEILSWLKRHNYRYLDWLYTEAYEKSIKIAKTTKDIQDELYNALHVYDWHNWENSQELQFPPVIDILLKRARAAKLNILDEESVIYLYNKGKDILYYTKFPFGEDIIIKPITNYTYSITFNEWGDFAGYFQESRDIDKDFIEKVLNGEGSDYFYGKSDDNDFPDLSGLNHYKIGKSVFKLLKEFVLKYYPEADQIEDFSDLYDYLYSLSKKGTLDKKIERCLIRAYNETIEVAQESEAYEELKQAIIDHFDLIDIKHSKEKFRGQIHSDGVKKLVMLYYARDAFEKQEVDYSAPYYGYSGDIEKHPDVFIDALLSAIDEFN